MIEILVLFTLHFDIGATFSVRFPALGNILEIGYESARNCLVFSCIIIKNPTDCGVLLILVENFVDYVPRRKFISSWTKLTLCELVQEDIHFL